MNKYQLEALTAAVTDALNSVTTFGQAAKSNKGEAVAAVRKVASEAHDLGVSYSDAGKVWQTVAKMEKRPEGTWKPYTKHVQGFVILADSGDIETMHDGKPATQAQAVEAFKLATTAPEVLAEEARINAAVKLFRLRITTDKDASTKYGWAAPSAATVDELLAMLDAHPSESTDVTAKVTKGDREAQEARDALAAMIEDAADEADESDERQAA